MICNSMMVLMQAEVERFHAGMSLLHDYYCAKMQQETSADETVSLVSNGIGQSCVLRSPSVVCSLLVTVVVVVVNDRSQYIGNIPQVKLGNTLQFTPPNVFVSVVKQLHEQAWRAKTKGVLLDKSLLCLQLILASFPPSFSLPRSRL